MFYGGEMGLTGDPESFLTWAFGTGQPVFPTTL